MVLQAAELLAVAVAAAMTLKAAVAEATISAAVALRVAAKAGRKFRTKIFRFNPPARQNERVVSGQSTLLRGLRRHKLGATDLPKKR